jgi:hypothetical protein
LPARRTRTRRSSAALLAALVLAGCDAGGGETQVASTAAPPPPSLPLEAAREVVPRASLLSLETATGSACKAARIATALRAAVIAAINDRYVRPQLQEVLLGEANALVEAIPCQPGRASEDAGRRALDFSLRVSKLARRGLARRRGPLDVRVRRAVVPADDLTLAVELVGLVPGEREREVTPGQRAVHALDVLFRDVANGGFQQFFENFPELADDILPAARLIGVAPYTSLVTAAVAAADEPARLRPLDDRMYALWERPGLAPEQLLAAYIEENPDEFFLEP